ncbi:MAG: hypothetical protein H7240_04155 [Glaciimonas sp.]|nr:hypothetical protein [Glaciimonas sp.]
MVVASSLAADRGQGGKFDMAEAILSTLALAAIVLAVDGLSRHDSIVAMN